MAKIRQNTDWNDPVAAKKANDEIKILSKELMMAGKNQNPASPVDSRKLEEEKEGVDYQMKLWGQMQESARQGEGADILLAKPIREEIKDEYKTDESPNSSCPQFLEEMTFLFIDMSSPTVHLVIDQMEKYKSINTLVITGGKNGSAVNLETLLAKAAKYPLQQLYIINFRNSVTKIPLSISNFRELTFLALYNNKISQLPPELNSLVSLKKLYVDMNPVATLLPAIGKLTNLDTLGIAKTQIANDELIRIKQQLPNCKIVLQ